MSIIILPGLGMEELTQQVCVAISAKPMKRRHLSDDQQENFIKTPGKIEVKKFLSGELRPQIQENVRGRTVFIIQSTDSAEHIVNLLLTLDALKRAAADRIIAVVPYFGYGRQERKDRPRVPISAALWCKLFREAGATAMLSFDLHAGSIQGFFDGPFDHLYASWVLIPAIKKYLDDNNIRLEQCVMVAPDRGRVEINGYYGKKLGINRLLFCGKQKEEIPGQAEARKTVIYIDGELPSNAVCISCDDIIDTLGTIAGMAYSIKEKGEKEGRPVKKILVSAVHPLFSDPARERIQAAPIDRVFTTDTVPLNPAVPKVQICSIASILAEAIYRIHYNMSISSLFE